MPVTPFHFGPGALLHSLAPKKTSFLAFCAANVVIDLEPLYYMLTGQYPLHRFFHTYIGATVAVLVTALLFMLMLRLASKIAYLKSFTAGFTRSAIILGAIAGGYSHIIFDSIMHDDIRPWAPFSQANGLLGMISLSSLHSFCLVSGILALFIFVAKNLIKNYKK